MEKDKEATIVHWGYIGIIENGSYCSILGFYRDNGKDLETTIVFGFLQKSQEHSLVKASTESPAWLLQTKNVYWVPTNVY